MSSIYSVTLCILGWITGTVGPAEAEGAGSGVAAGPVLGLSAASLLGVGLGAVGADCSAGGAALPKSLSHQDAAALVSIDPPRTARAIAKPVGACHLRALILTADEPSPFAAQNLNPIIDRPLTLC
ncbi:MAG TPA: hypothetical protein VLZ74_14160 [Methylocella sp.]|nr:hypothetical protein [Methylocella sp.]